MRATTNCLLYLAVAFIFLNCLQVQAQPPFTKKDYRPGALSIAYFIESANNSINSLNSLLKKDNYRNKITTLNNPTNNELGFNLKNEILEALKPLLEKAKKVNNNKFHQVIDNLLSNPEEGSLNTTIRKYLPATAIFSTVISLVSNLVITEKKITTEDLNKFVTRIQQYFSQYEKLNTINEQFSLQVQGLLERSEEIKEDLKDFLIDCICTMNKKITKASIKDLAVEVLIQKYYDPQKLQSAFDTMKTKTDGVIYPPDAPTTVKMLTSSIKKLQKEFEAIYNDNYTQLKELIASLKSSIPNLDETQLDKTQGDIDRLYADSRQADVINLNITQVDERMTTVCNIINTR